MDEGCIEILFVGLFWLAAVVIVGGFAVAAGGSIAAMAFVVGACESLARFMARFVGTYWFESSVPLRLVTADEPAATGYFFGPSFASITSASAQGAIGSQVAGERFSENPETAETLMKWVLRAWNLGGVLGVGVGQIVARVFLQLPATLVAAVFALVAAAIGAVTWVGQKAITLVRRVGYTCANEGCYARGQVPVYACPACGARHAKLWPNRYGVLYHTCRCGQALPTLAVLGRRNLAASCRICGGALEGGETTDVHLVVVGASGNGRSSSAVAIIDALAASGGSQALQPADSAALELYKRSVKAGSEPVGAPHITVLTHRGEGLDTGESVYVYDSPAEFSEAEAADQAFYDHIDAIAFIVAASQADLRAAATAGGSAIRPELDSLYARVLKTFDSHSGQSAASIRRARLAIVLTGTPSELEAAGSGTVDASAGAQSDGALRAWLESIGQGNILRLVASDFKLVRFFAVPTVSLSQGPSADSLVPAVDWLLEGRRKIAKAQAA